MIKLPETPLNESKADPYASPGPAPQSNQSSASKLAALDPHPFWSDSSVSSPRTQRRIGDSNALLTRRIGLGLPVSLGS